MTKKELEEKNKALRAELDKAHAQLKEFETVKNLQGELDEKAIGGYYIKGQGWMLAEIGFNKETMEAKVMDIKKAGNDFAMFMYGVNKFIAEKINLRSMR